jgi:hypothetical protein
LIEPQTVYGAFCDRCGSYQVFSVALGSAKEQRLKVRALMKQADPPWEEGIEGDLCPACAHPEEPPQTNGQ